MSRADRRPILLLVNPRAGGKPGSEPSQEGDAARRPESLAEALRSGGAQVRLHVLGEADDVAVLAARGAEQHDVVAAGGDGTAGVVAGALLGTRATLGILPLGLTPVEIRLDPGALRVFGSANRDVAPS